MPEPYITATARGFAFQSLEAFMEDIRRRMEEQARLAPAVGFQVSSYSGVPIEENLHRCRNCGRIHDGREG